MPTLLNKKRSASSLRRQAAPALIFGDLWAYDPAPETADPKLKTRYELFIGGKFVAPASGKYFDSINPANEQKLAEIARANAADVAAAYRAAKKAYDQTWSRLPGRERAKYLFRIARLLQDRAREFAVAETMDGGKPIKESRDFDVPMAAAHFFYHAGWADKLEYVAPGRRVAPLGVVGQVIPWNFPLLMLAWKIAPALAMGNCVVEYGELLARHVSRIFSVERGGQPIATMEVRRCKRTGKPLVVQLQDRENLKCPLHYWHSASLFADRFGAVLPEPLPVVPGGADRFASLFAAYRMSRARDEQLRFRHVSFATLRTDMAAIAELAVESFQWQQWS